MRKMRNVKNRFEISMTDRDITASVFKKNALVVLDTNVLIGLLQQRKTITEKILERIENKSAKIYIPFFVSWEYAANNNKILNAPIQTRTSKKDVKSSLEISKKRIKSCVESAISPKGDALFWGKSVKEIKDSAFTEIMHQFDDLEKKVLSKQQEVETQLKKSDGEVQQVNKRLLDFIDLHVSDGTNIKQDWIEKNEKKGEKRYENEIGPGFADVEKKEGKLRQYGNLSYQTKYGDFLIWQEVLDYMRDNQNFDTLVYVTNDRKDIYDGTTSYPAQHLFGDLYEATGKPTHLYVCDIEKVIKLLKADIDYMPVHDYDAIIKDEPISEKINKIVEEQIENDEDFSDRLSEWIFEKAPDSEDMPEGKGFKTGVEDLTIDTIQALVSDISIDEIPFTASLSGEAVITYAGNNPAYERNINDGTPAEISQSITLNFEVNAEGAYDLSGGQFEDTEFSGDVNSEDDDIDYS